MRIRSVWMKKMRKMEGGEIKTKSDYKSKTKNDGIELVVGRYPGSSIS